VLEGNRKPTPGYAWVSVAEPALCADPAYFWERRNRREELMGNVSLLLRLPTTALAVVIYSFSESVGSIRARDEIFVGV